MRCLLALAQPAKPLSGTDLGAGLAMLQGAGGNLLLSVGEDGAFLVDDQGTFHWHGHTVQVQHLDPAHTDGDSAVHLVEADVLAAMR